MGTKNTSVKNDRCTNCPRKVECLSEKQKAKSRETSLSYWMTKVDINCKTC